MNVDLLFDCLADPTRRRILALLVAQGELCVCELTAAVDDIQPKISRHLGVLKDAGIVTARRDGTWMFYRPVAALPAWAAAILAALPQSAGKQLRADLQRLKVMAGRPQRCATRRTERAVA